ncbi:DUF6538 domain-containing protein [Dyella sp. 20L07]|uniref:DUF6538 domain-containing protein n=1 Tax=Dyella sp. 20L07 TaxID=3384240 RepID=UPI003D28A182
MDTPPCVFRIIWFVLRGAFFTSVKKSRALQSVVGLRVIKRSLGTRDPRTAPAREWLIAERCAQAIERAGQTRQRPSQTKASRPCPLVAQSRADYE